MSRFLILIKQIKNGFANYKLRRDYGFDPLDLYMMAIRAQTHIEHIYLAYIANKNFCKKFAFLTPYT